MQFKVLAVMACALLGACSHVVQSQRCETYWNCPEADGDALQTYALPVTMVDFTFAKPANAWTLTAAARNVPDDDPRYRFRLDYLPHAGADDDFTLTVSNGLLSSVDSNSSTQLPDVVQTLSPVARAILGGGAVAGAPEPISDGDWTSREPLERRNAVLAEDPADAFAFVPVAAAVTCTVEQLMAGTPQFAEMSANRGANFDNTCHTTVGAEIRTVRLSCARAPRQMLDLNEMRALFGEITAKSACTGDAGRSGEFSFDYTVAVVQLLIAADPNAANYRHWTSGVAETGQHPYSVQGCESNIDTTASAGCFPNGREGSLFYRTTASLQTTTALCRQELGYNLRQRNNERPVRVLANSCQAMAPGEMPFAGAGHRFGAVVRRAAYVIDVPRSVGADHRKYTFTNGVLEGVEIDRTGAALGLVRLPLTIFGIGDE